jgi:hypothetical protein
VSSAPSAAQPAPVAQTISDTKADTAPKASAGPSLEQVQQMAADVTALHQTVDQLSAGQNQMADDIAKLQAANDMILQKLTPPSPQKVSAPLAPPLPQTAARPAHKHMPALAPSPGAPLPLR